MQDPTKDTNPQPEDGTTTSESTETIPKAPSEKKQKPKLTESKPLKEAILGFARKYKVGLKTFDKKTQDVLLLNFPEEGTDKHYIGFCCTTKEGATNLSGEVNRSALARNVIQEGERPLCYSSQTNKHLVLFYTESVSKILILAKKHRGGAEITDQNKLISEERLEILSPLLMGFASRYKGVALKLVKIKRMEEQESGKKFARVNKHPDKRRITNLTVLIYNNIGGTYGFYCKNKLAASLLIKKLNNSARNRGFIKKNQAILFPGWVEKSFVQFYPRAIKILKKLSVDHQEKPDEGHDWKSKAAKWWAEGGEEAILTPSPKREKHRSSKSKSMPKKPLPTLPQQEQGETPLIDMEGIPKREPMPADWFVSSSQNPPSETTTSTNSPTETLPETTSSSTGALLDLFGGDMSVNKLSAAIGGIQIQSQTTTSSSESFALLGGLTTPDLKHPEGKVTIDNITELTGTERCEKEGITQSGGKIHLVFTNEGYRGLAKQALFKLGYEARVTESTTQGSPKKHVLHFQGTKQELEQVIRETNAPKEEKIEDYSNDLIPDVYDS